MRTPKAMARGFVHLVGAGPGDPELITVRGMRRLQRAEVVVHDRLVSGELIDEAPRDARRIDVGKEPGRHRWSQERINRLLIAEARRGRRVVRLKGGDPFVFGRGGEECAALVAAGIPFEVVPGVSSAVAAPSAAGIPVTDRRFSSSFTVVTGHGPNGAGLEPDWARLAYAETLVVMMGLSRLHEVTTALMRHGRPACTPAAVISRATMPDAVVVRGSLADIAAAGSTLRSPATLVVGDVARLAQEIGQLVRDVVVA